MTRYPETYETETARKMAASDAQTMRLLCGDHDAGVYDLETLWDALFDLIERGRVRAITVSAALADAHRAREHVRDEVEGHG